MNVRYFALLREQLPPPTKTNQVGQLFQNRVHEAGDKCFLESPPQQQQRYWLLIGANLIV